MDSPDQLSPMERTRLLGLAALIFVILASYAVARPATESLFLEANGADKEPIAWLGVGIGSLIVVTLYNRWSAAIDLVRMFGFVSAISTGTLTLILLALGLETPGTTFGEWLSGAATLSDTTQNTLLVAGSAIDTAATHANALAVWALYLWKDLYIVVLVEIFWSFANSTVPKDRAKWWYGMFCVLGSLGGMAGNLGVGWLASTWSTQQSLWAVVPLLLFGGIGGFVLARLTGVSGEPKAEPASIKDGFAVLKNSRALWPLMGLIGATQVAITLIDYQFKVAIEEFYPDVDARTAAIGKMYASIDVMALGLQLGTGPILRILGVPLVLLAIPSLLGVAVAGYALVPRYAAIAAAKIASKAFDYSLFRAAKEILYIPLSHSEQTQGKAFVDMMSYRMAKGATSVMLLGLIAMGEPQAALWLTMACIGLWIWITVQLNRDSTNPNPDEPKQLA